VACLSLAVVGAPKVFGDEQSTSPYATAADFAKYAMRLREQALLKVEPQVLIPTSLPPGGPAVSVENEHCHDSVLGR
jgi:hypothetical protein